MLSKKEELSSALTEFPYDIIAITEVKPKHGKISSIATLNLDGYDLYNNDFDEPDTRGVCIYTKKHLSVSQVFPTTVNEFNDSVWIHVKKLGHSSEVLLGCIYRSGTPATASKYDKGLYEQMLWAAQNCNHSHKIITGDFNMPNITWTPEPTLTPRSSRGTDSDSSNMQSRSSAITISEQMFVDCINDTFFHQFITEDTRYRNNNSSVLDLIFANEDSTVEKITYLDPLGASDHVCITFEIPVKPSYTKKKKILYSKGNYDKLRTIIKDIDWDSIINNKQDLQETYNSFETIINNGINCCIPKIVVSDTPRSKPLWMTPDALKGSKVKRCLWAKYKQTRHRKDYQVYAKARNKNTQELRAARRKFEKKLARNVQNNVKGFWNYVNSNKKNKSKVNDLKNSMGAFISEDIKKAEILNNQYAKTFTIENLSEIPTFTEKTLLTDPLDSIKIEESYVKILLLDLRTDKSPGPDQIHPRILKETAIHICKPLTKLFKLSISQGRVPQQWKLANIVPIFKKGCRSSPENYRPVSLTSIISKLMEKIISKQMMEHILVNDILPKQQHGFLQGKSTSTNLLEALNVWIEMQEHNLPVDIIYLDYSKAFDTVPHKRLVGKLSSIGIKGNLLTWIKDFLSDRKQRVLVNTGTSKWTEVLSGVPQGSVLGPLLFIIFVSEIPSLVNNFISLFADDTKLYGKNCGTGLQEDLTKIVDWSKLMQMNFNAGKCKVMHLGKNNPCLQYNMEDNDGLLCSLERTAIERDLGIYIDEKLLFSDHITNQVNKANRALGALKHTFKYIDTYSFKCLYKCLIRPYLEYASVAWTAKFKYNQDQIERVQRRATKIVPEIKHQTYSERLQALELPTLLYRRKRADILQMYKFIHGFDFFDFERTCEICEKPVFEWSLATQTRGHAYKLQHHLCGTTKKKSFFGRVVPLWNNLEMDTVNSDTVNTFKNRLAKEWSSHKDKYNYRFSY